MNKEIILQIHAYLVDYFTNSEDPISPPGVKHDDLLESAIARPFQSACGSDCYPNVFQKAAALFHSLIGNHCFHNGNKRTALLSVLVYLDDQGFWVDKCDDDEMFEFTRKVAAHEITDNRTEETEIITTWLELNSRKTSKANHRLKYRDLKEILSRFGFELEEAPGNIIEITYSGEVRERILKKGQKGQEDYDQEYIQKLRKKLDLTPEHGIDSLRFYGQKGVSDTLSEFMRLRGDVIRKLAKI